MITHIVFFRLTESSRESVAGIRDMLLSMQGKIPQLRHLEVGVDVIGTERSYDLALVTRFESLADLQTYQVHPYHAETVVPFIKQMGTSTVTVDYES